MSWEVMLKQLHKGTTTGKGIEEPANTSKSLRKNEKGSPSYTSEKRKRFEQVEKASPSNKRTASAPAEETTSTPENDNMSVLVDTTKFAEVEDNALLANFIKKPRKKSIVSNEGKEPQSP